MSFSLQKTFHRLTLFYLLYLDLGRAWLVVNWEAKSHLCPYPYVPT